MATILPTAAGPPQVVGDVLPADSPMSPNDEDLVQSCSENGLPSRASSQPEPEPGTAGKTASCFEAGGIRGSEVEGRRPALMSNAMREVRQLSEAAATSEQGWPVSAFQERRHSENSLASFGTRVRRRLESVYNELDKVTGQEGDVVRDPAAYGEASLTFKDIEFSVRLKDGAERLILAPTSGHFKAGSLVALMGPSGCGKTTLLDILANKKTSPWRGTVHLNGRPRDKLFERVTTYIPQDDIMPAHLTVSEVVAFYSSLKIQAPSNMPRATRRLFVEQRLRFLGLGDVADTKIGNETVRGISGGQRRRVSLACGLSSMAHLFFADEPTSGLSGTDAEACVRYMRLLAKKFGVTLVVAIHQPRPEVARLFDHLLLLTSNPGSAVYNGPMREAAEVWAKVGFPVPEFANPTDYFLDLVTPGAKTDQCDTFVHFYQSRLKPQVDEVVISELNRPRKTALELLETRRTAMMSFGGGGEFPPVRNSVYGVSFSAQLCTVFRRQLRLSLRDPLGINMELGVAVGQSVVIGVTYLGVGEKEAYNQMLFYFMLAMTVALVGMKVMPKLVDERLVVKKETSEALYSDWAYIISFSVINMITGFLGNSIFVTLVFWMSSCSWDMFPTVFFWTTVLYLVMDSVYTMIAAVAKDSTSSITMTLPFLTLFLLYNNFTVYAEILPSFMQWLLRLSPVAYTIGQIAYEANELDPQHFKSLAEQRGYADHRGVALAVMVGYWVLFRGLSVVCLKNLNNIRR